MIDGGELVSYRVDGYEFIHQKGSPGWGQSDTEMFPVIGPTAEASYRVQVPRGNALQDQHGLLRDMAYSLKGQSAAGATFVKEYQAGTPVKNTKYPDRSPMQWGVWPYSFHFEKSFTLTDEGLEVRFTLKGERDMPYMMGYHPAFKLRSPRPTVQAGETAVTLREVLAVGSRALLLPGLEEVTLKDEKILHLRTSGFGHFMLWTEVPNMICIEPITFYPYAVAQKDLHQGFEFLGEDARQFSLWLRPDSATRT